MYEEQTTINYNINNSNVSIIVSESEYLDYYYILYGYCYNLDC